MTCCAKDLQFTMSFTALLVLGFVLLYNGAFAQTQEGTVVFRIEEEQPSRTLVGNIIEKANLSTVYSQDVLSNLNFKFRESHSLFEIMERTGLIRTRRVIDREELDECMYSMTCSVNLEVMITPYAYFKIVPVIIYILDINDHAPEFSQPRVSLDISENVLLNTAFKIGSAEDPDSGVLGIAGYELLTPSEYFDIDVNTLPDGTMDLSIVVLQELDRERDNFFSLQIRALDGDAPPKSSTVTVDISVVDWNDNSPVFDKELYEAQIYENLDPNTPVIQVHARDRDEGANGVVYYTFEAHTLNNFGSYFGLHNGTGLIFVKGSIDYENHKSFHLTVVANDLGKNSIPDYAKVNIDILDVNDNAPEISVNTFTETHYARVPENVATGHTVAYVGVSDPDSGRGGNITCQIDNSNFRILGRPNSGSIGFEIVSGKMFDREDQDQYMVLIRCEDHGSPQKTSSYRVPVRVTDSNDNAPYFLPNTTLFAVSVYENNKLDQVIMKMNASDRDTMENAAIRYSVEAIGDTPPNAITIDLITGVIQAKAEFDYETRNFYEYKIRATDQGNPPRYAETRFQLNILDHNDGFPHFIKKSYFFKVRENQVANTEVGQVQAVDNDAFPFNEIKYSLAPLPNSYKFQINEDTGVIETATVIDHEEAAVFHLTAVATNPGTPEVRSTVNITIQVDDENDNPPEITFPTESNRTVQVPTRMKIGYHVTQILAEDPDGGENGHIYFDISSGNEGGVFAIDRDTGAISTAQATDMVHKATQTLIIKVRDNGAPQKTTFSRLVIMFNNSVALPDGSSTMLPQDTLTVLIVAAVAGCLFIVIIIALAICCVRRARRRKNKKKHVYNCRAEEAKKALANGDRNNSTLSGDSSQGSDQSIDTAVGNKTKEKGKKEVTFSVDMDEGWPQNTEKAVIENPNAQHIDPSDCRPPSYPERERAPVAMTPDERPACPPSQPIVQRHGSCCMCQKHGPAPPLTQHNLDMLEYCNQYWPMDHDSESGCSGTDSGRGPSEEGEFGHHVDPNRHAHDQCAHGNCCCSSGIYARKLHPHHHPGTHGYGPAPCHAAVHRPPCHCCGPTHVPHPPAFSHRHSCGSICGSTCGSTCEHNTSKSSMVHDCTIDECTPLETLPPFHRPPFKDRMYPKLSRFNSDCASRQARGRLSLDPEEMSRHRHYGHAPSLPSLSDNRHITPSPTFTSASDSQFYPYTGAHSQNRMYPGSKAGAFTPIKRVHSGEEGQGSITVSDDGTTTSGSYSMETVTEVPTNTESIPIDANTEDCYV